MNSLRFLKTRFSTDTEFWYLKTQQILAIKILHSIDTSCIHLADEN